MSQAKSPKSNKAPKSSQSVGAIGTAGDEANCERSGGGDGMTNHYFQGAERSHQNAELNAISRGNHKTGFILSLIGYSVWLGFLIFVAVKVSY